MEDFPQHLDPVSVSHPLVPLPGEDVDVEVDEEDKEEKNKYTDEFPST